MLHEAGARRKAYMRVCLHRGKDKECRSVFVVTKRRPVSPPAGYADPLRPRPLLSGISLNSGASACVRRAEVTRQAQGGTTLRTAREPKEITRRVKGHGK